MAFHDIRFPTDISLASRGGPERRTEIVALGSGHEERNSRWADSRRRYNAGYGVKTLDELYAVIAFFEERRGKLYGFRWKDQTDFQSASPDQSITPTDQIIGIGDGTTTTFQLQKTYGGAFEPYSRKVTKPVEGTVLIAVNGQEQQSGVAFITDHNTGIITFQSGFIPVMNAEINAGFEFDVPVRFDTDNLTIDLSQFSAGSIPDIPVVEVRL